MNVIYGTINRPKGAVRKITTLEQIEELALQRKSVIGVFVWNEKPIPAAWVFNMQPRLLLDAFRAGLWLYSAKRARNQKENAA